LVYTANFKAAARFLGVRRCVSIARMARFWMGESYPCLAPPWGLVRSFKRGEIDEGDFRDAYRSEVLDKLDAQEIAGELDGAVLLCFEPPGQFCHRGLVAEWLQEAGIKTSEVGVADGSHSGA